MTPFTPDESATLNRMLLHAAHEGDTEGLKVLKPLTTNPDRFRELMRDAPKEAGSVAEHAASSPFPGGVFNDTTHHWELPDQPKGGTKPTAKTKPNPGSKPAITTPTAPPEEPNPPPAVEKAKREKILVNAEVQRFAEEQNERAASHAFGGVSLPDGEPVDVWIPANPAELPDLRAQSDAHRDATAAFNQGVSKKRPESFRPSGEPAFAVELKTMFSNAAGRVSMKLDARKKKAAWERRTGKEIHTVVIDDQAVFNANGPGQHDFSKRRVFYKRGFGNYAISGMQEVQGGLEGVRTLAEMPTNKLPPNARRINPRGRAGAAKKKETVSRLVGEPGEHPDKGKPPGANTQVGGEHRATVAEWVAKSPGLPPETAEKYTATMATALGKMTPQCREIALKEITRGRTTFHPDPRAVNDACSAISGRKERGVIGFVHTSGGGPPHLHVDGDSPGAPALGTYLHELGHVVASHVDANDDPKWVSALKREIHGGKNLLSRYARESATEGFAELHRAIGEKGLEAVESKWPKCVAYMRTKGLV